VPGWQVLRVRSTARVHLIDITREAAALIPPKADGALILATPHTTAGLLLNEHESGLVRDIEAWMEKVAPSRADYAHNRIDDNADAHLRAIVLGPALVIPVEEGRLALGTWQRVFFVELDGPRDREVRGRVID
jgi:secondary thiamine-phosphate synthase enzyme